MTSSAWTPQRRRLGTMVGAGAIALGVFAFGAAGAGARSGAAVSPEDAAPTKTPIKHVIVIIGENRTFDHVFGTFIPRSGDSIFNLRSQGIVNADGTPGPSAGKAAQFTVSPQPHYFISAPTGSKTPYTTLPPPDLNGVHTSASDSNPIPFTTVGAAEAAEPSISTEDAPLLTTGASGLPFMPETTGGGLTPTPNGVRNPDTRILNAKKLPNGPYQLTAKDFRGNGLDYDEYAEDTIHQFFQMWQQSDCAVANATPNNPTGCLSDLYPFVVTTAAGLTEQGQSMSMSFFNVNQGDARVLRRLAEEFTLSDNYHQGVMGGTGANHIMLGTGDAYYFNDGHGNPLPPPPLNGAFVGLSPTLTIPLVANPEPLPNTNNAYTNSLTPFYTNCSDTTQPGISAIATYLSALPYASGPTSCAQSTFYVVNNIFPGFHPDGTLASLANFPKTQDISDLIFVPPQTVPNIGDALNAKNISWKYYGGGYNQAVAHNTANAYCPICNPMQYSVNYPANRVAHTRDMLDLFTDIQNNTLPSVSIVKPSGFLDGHPQSSKLDLFEAQVDDIVSRVQSNRKLFQETAILITFDEGGGMYDSGFIQILDKFGDGPRIPMLIVSDFSRGGHIDHTYADHASILKFIEANWLLSPLSIRSRDNLPNPTSGPTPYVPGNMPAIGDLMSMFKFN
ncbi:MAG TPA: alkaline phosphatase family protein [Stellaceae bacterium]|nr:alkaline phosphatase family protein [Stellaceae bacterium]